MTNLKASDPAASPNSINTLTLRVFVEPTGKCPTRGKVGDAGLDCYADLFCNSFRKITQDGSLSLEAIREGFDSFNLGLSEAAKIPLGFHYAFFVDGVLSTDYWLDIRNRSGFGTTAGVVELASVCDASYRGVPHYAIAKVTTGVVTVTHGQKICQALITPFVDPYKVNIEIVDSLEALGATTRGASGFGSTGG